MLSHPENAHITRVGGDEFALRVPRLTGSQTFPCLRNTRCDLVTLEVVNYTV